MKRTIIRVETDSLYIHDTRVTIPSSSSSPPPSATRPYAVDREGLIASSRLLLLYYD